MRAVGGKREEGAKSLVKSPPSTHPPVKAAGAPGGLAFVFTGIIKTHCLSGKINKSCSKVQENYALQQYCSPGTTGGGTGKVFKYPCQDRLHWHACLLSCGRLTRSSPLQKRLCVCVPHRHTLQYLQYFWINYTICIPDRRARNRQETGQLGVSLGNFLSLIWLTAPLVLSCIRSKLNYNRTNIREHLFGTTP